MPTFLQNVQATQPITQGTLFTSADTTVAKAIVSPQPGPWHLLELMLSSNDTADAIFDVYVRQSAVNYHIGSVTVPAGSGLGALPTVNFLTDTQPAVLTGMDFTQDVAIYGAVESTLTAAKTLTVVAFSLLY